MGSRGDSYDNASTETIHGLCKAGLIHRRANYRRLLAGQTTSVAV